MGAIAAFVAKFGTAIQFLIPLLRLLWKILNPKIKGILDTLWDYTEDYVEKELQTLEKKNLGDSKSKIKEAVFNTTAKKALSSQGYSLTTAELNLARELIHYKKVKPKTRKVKSRKQTKKQTKKSCKQTKKSKSSNNQ